MTGLYRLYTFYTVSQRQPDTARSASHPGWPRVAFGSVKPTQQRPAKYQYAADTEDLLIPAWIGSHTSHWDIANKS